MSRLQAAWPSLWARCSIRDFDKVMTVALGARSLSVLGLSDYRQPIILLPTHDPKTIVELSLLTGH
jgi:hypothetical protein